jgi:hypothetical protein
MYLKKIVCALPFFFFAASANADLEPWTDYEASDEVYLVTTIKVDSNMEDAYLEGLRETWIPGNKAAMELGQIKDWAIYRSQFSEAGDFNLILVVTLSSAADLQPSKERYDALIEKIGKEASDESTEYAHEITGNYMMRKITIK